MNTTITAECNADKDFVESPSGCIPIATLQVTHYGDRVSIDGISRQGKTLKGGFFIDKQSWDNLVEQILLDSKDGV